MNIASLDQYFIFYSSYRYIRLQFVTPKIMKIDKDISRENVVNMFYSKKTKSKAKKILSRKCVVCKADAKFFVFCTTKKNKGLFTFDYIPMTVDHIIPKCYGGNDHQENMQIMCGLCNRIKGHEFETQTLIGKKVRRINGVLFKSGNAVNTVSNILKNRAGLPFFQFLEDDSALRCSSCVIL